MNNQRARKGGFTLVELLVVVAIISLLIAILAPAINAARRAGRINTDVANMKQHGAGVDAYAASNQDTLPNHPLSPGFPNASDLAAYGPRGVVSHSFATDKLPTNGWDFPGSGDATPGITFMPLTVFNEVGLDQESMWGSYVITLSEYMSEGQSVPTLNEVFLSPAHALRRETWQNWKFSFRTGQAAPNGVNYAPGGAGTLPKTTPGPAQNVMGFGTYKYTMPGYTSPGAWSLMVGGQPSQEMQQYFSSNAYTSQPPDRFSGGRTIVLRNPKSQVSYPSSKVMFYSALAIHDPGVADWWFNEGATCIVCMGDGSGRSIRPTIDAINVDVTTAEGLAQAVEGAGAFFETTLASGGTFTGYFTGTYGGIRGRDL